ncbi:MAG: SusD/RagB family nutrient-binding outer membrane lipoprotein [Bacteroidia bacterium]|nr:SusD/RagB family nutrient-binding outer membrane lipoprotein [Bacteroidia bacterium]
MKYIAILLFSLLILSACQSLNEGINDNPNDITIDAIQAQSFLTGAQLGNIQVQVGHLQRISALWTRQLIGFQSSYRSIDQYNITTAETNSTWNRAYHSSLSQLRVIQEKAIDNPQLTAIAQIIEAHTIGTMATLFGDVPYSEAATEGIAEPNFDGQLAVFNELLSLLDLAIQSLDALETELLIREDIYFEGNVQKWTETAWTLKARYHLQMGDYAMAYEAAQKGISDPANSLLFQPIDDNNTDNKNLFWQLAAGSRAGDIGNLKDEEASYLLQMLSDTASISRVHGKTREASRLAYYIIFDNDANANQGVASAIQAMPMVTFGENALILAETGARSQSFEVGLGHLNEWRSYLNSGEAFTILDPGLELVYLGLDEDDFEEDGLENPDGVDPLTALLREIIEERYVSGFGTYMPFNDARRLRDAEPELAVDFPLSVSGADCFPQRFLYSAREIDANNNAPTDPGLCSKTAVNQ